jgi:transposase-like protein
VSKKCWRCAEFHSHTKQSENGASSLARVSQTACDAELLVLGDRWHLDEVLLKINGRIHYLWRAVDQDGDVLDILVQRKRDRGAAKKIFRKLSPARKGNARLLELTRNPLKSTTRLKYLSPTRHCSGRHLGSRHHSFKELGVSLPRRRPRARSSKISPLIH